MLLLLTISGQQRNNRKLGRKRDCWAAFSRSLLGSVVHNRHLHPKITKTRVCRTFRWLLIIFWTFECCIEKIFFNHLLIEPARFDQSILHLLGHDKDKGWKKEQWMMRLSASILSQSKWNGITWLQLDPDCTAVKCGGETTLECCQKQVLNTIQNGGKLGETFGIPAPKTCKIIHRIQGKRTVFAAHVVHKLLTKAWKLGHPGNVDYGLLWLAAWTLNGVWE